MARNGFTSIFIGIATETVSKNVPFQDKTNYNENPMKVELLKVDIN